ncbi:MAG: hypothetical protein ACRD4B_01125, partial [Acidobacteriota bacterium]
STSATATATASFSVLNYTSYGYIVNVVGNPPAAGSYTLAGITTDPTDPNSTSQQGVEQFGINLVRNIDFLGVGNDLGADPAQVPDGTFSFGSVTTNYSVPGRFHYVPGETIASAPKSSGQTDYTISYIVNVSTDSGGGQYTGSQTIVCTGTY